MIATKDIIGKRFGRLVVKNFSRRDAAYRWGRVFWCKCDCGSKLKEVRWSCLSSGATKRCGCWAREIQAIAKVTHGHTRDRRASLTYGSYTNMLARCLNPNDSHFKWYGRAGVKICDRWNPLKGGSFEKFLADMGERTSRRLTLGRILDCPLYSKKTCEWESMPTQGCERRGHNAQVRLHRYHEAHRCRRTR